MPLEFWPFSSTSSLQKHLLWQLKSSGSLYSLEDKQLHFGNTRLLEKRSGKRWRRVTNILFKYKRPFQLLSEISLKVYRWSETTSPC
jgi:hypothetical protein